MELLAKSNNFYVLSIYIYIYKTDNKYKNSFN